MLKVSWWVASCERLDRFVIRGLSFSSACPRGLASKTEMRLVAAL